MKFRIIGTLVFLIIFIITVVVITVMKNNANNDLEDQPAKTGYTQ